MYEKFGNAPWAHETDRLWFEFPKSDAWPREGIRTDGQLLYAFLASAIGKHDCPLDGNWAGACLVGGIVVALSDNASMLAPTEHFNRPYDLGEYAWQRLWDAFERDEASRLDKAFRASLLRLFLPRQHHCPPDRPYYSSDFVELWRSAECADTSMRWVGNLRLRTLREGRKARETLAPEVLASIDLVAPHVPPILAAANSYLHANRG